MWKIVANYHLLGCILKLKFTLIFLKPKSFAAVDSFILLRFVNLCLSVLKAASLTMEGGRLKQSPHLVEGRDYIMVPEPVWRALYHWYGANLSLPRPVSNIYSHCLFETDTEVMDHYNPGLAVLLLTQDLPVHFWRLPFQTLLYTMKNMQSTFKE